MQWYLKVISNYVAFSGRATRAEFWMFFLVNMIISIVLSILDRVLGTRQVLGNLYDLAVLLPSLSVGFRRLHDTGRTGAWIFINLIPVIGWIIYIIYLCEDSQPIDNQYGPNPKKAEIF